MRRFLVLPVLGTGHVNPMGAIASELADRGDAVTLLAPERYVGDLAGGAVDVVTLPDGVMPDLGRATDARGVVRDVARLLRAPREYAEAVARAPAGTVVVRDALTAWRLGRPDAAVATGALTSGAKLAAGLRVPRLAGALDRLPLPFSSHADLVVVTVPREYQPHGESFGGRYRFVGPCVMPRRSEAGDPLTVDDGDPRPLVLVSLGTTLNDRPDFFRACLAAAAGRPWRVVVAVGDRVDVAGLGPVPDNVVVRARVPQLALLARASAFVSHAGMNSVMESLSAGVPLALYPQQPEQRANARDVVSRGAGVLLPGRPTTSDVAGAVEHLLAEPGPRAAAASLASALAASGGRAEAADALQAFADRRAA